MERQTSYYKALTMPEHRQHYDELTQLMWSAMEYLASITAERAVVANLIQQGSNET
jgi:hypothetical protein